MLYNIRYELNKIKEKVLMAIVWSLPKVLVKWAYVRVVAHATTGKYEKTELPGLDVVEVIQRWNG